MINLYKLLNVLEQGMSLFQLNKWKTEGIWYPITQYKKDYTLYLSDPQAQYNKLLRTQQKLRNKKKWTSSIT